MGDQNQEPIDGQNLDEQLQGTHEFSMLRLNSFNLSSSTISLPLSLGTLAATQNAKPCSSPEHINGVATPPSMRGSASASESQTNGVCLIPHLHLPRPFLAPRVRRYGSGFDQGRNSQFNEAEKNEGSSERDEAMVGRSHAGGDAEEAVNVEWAEKCLSIHFKCLWLSDSSLWKQVLLQASLGV